MMMNNKTSYYTIGIVAVLIMTITSYLTYTQAKEKKGVLELKTLKNVKVFIDGEYHKTSSDSDKWNVTKVYLSPGEHELTAYSEWKKSPWVSLMVKKQATKNTRKKEYDDLYRALLKAENRDEKLRIRKEMLAINVIKQPEVIPFSIQKGKVSSLKLVSGGWYFHPKLSMQETNRLFELVSTDILRDDPLRQEDFIAQGNGTVIDKITGLQWMRCSLGQQWDGKTCQGSAQKTYPSKARETRFAGYDDWRIPTRFELETLIYCGKNVKFIKKRFQNLISGECGSSMDITDQSIFSQSKKTKRPTIITDIFPNTLEQSYLTSSPTFGYVWLENTKEHAMFAIDFKIGGIGITHEGQNSSEHRKYYFRLVRTINSGDGLR